METVDILKAVELPLSAFVYVIVNITCQQWNSRLSFSLNSENNKKKNSGNILFGEIRALRLQHFSLKEEVNEPGNSNEKRYSRRTHVACSYIQQFVKNSTER